MGSADGLILGTTTLLDHGPPSHRLNLLILAEGYQLDELTTFETFADDLVTGLLGTAPFDCIDLESAFNVFRVDVASTESGADDPVTCKGGTGATPATLFDATFCHQGISRLMTVDWALLEDVAGSVLPEWHCAIVIVNSSKYGASGPTLASGGRVVVTTTAPPFVDRTLHELGHAVFALADEYETYAGCRSGEVGHDHYSGAEPPEANVTTDSDPATIKWNGLITAGVPVPTTENADCTKCDPQPTPVPAGTVGAFEGAKYFHCGLFRPEFQCLMRQNGVRYCAVCREQIRIVLAPFQAFVTVPADGAADVMPWPAAISWTAGAFESSWEVQLSETSDFSDKVQTYTTADHGIDQGVKVGKIELLLEAGVLYHWRVRKMGRTGDDGWTMARTFTTAPQKPVALYPKSSERRGKAHPWDLPFAWTSVDGAMNYELEIATDAAFTNPIAPADFILETETVKDIRVDLKQYWRVRARRTNASFADQLRGAWSDTAMVVTTMPKVALARPYTGEGVYPWPVDLSWHEVKGAERYLVEVTGEKGEFHPSILEAGIDILAPQTWTTDLNMPARYLFDNDVHVWRVRVFGPGPFFEEGSPSDERHFIIDGDSTVVQCIAPLWDASKGAAGIPWLKSFVHLQWKHVVNAEGYRVTLWERFDHVVGIQGKVYDEPVPRDDSDPDQQQETISRAALNPQEGIVGYSWNITAIGPEKLPGLGGENVLPLYVYPDPPEPVYPGPDATDVAYGQNVFVIKNTFTPSGTYWVRFQAGSCVAASGESNYFIVQADPGKETAFGVDVPPGTSQNWSVRARSALMIENTNHPVIDGAYPWSPCHTYSTKPKPVEEPVTPEVLGEGWQGSWGLMLCMFKASPGADHYIIEVEEVDPNDLTFTIGPVQSFDFSLAAIQAFTTEFEQVTGLEIPVPWLLIGLSGTVALHAYRWKIRACNENVCSAFSGYGYWAEYFSWPFG